jgi:RNA polymerase sigma-70 factor (ECF subfamily)
VLRKIARHAIIDMRRGAETWSDCLDIDTVPESEAALTVPSHLQPEAICALSRSVEAYQETIAALSPRCCEAFALYVSDNLTNQEIARRMGVSLARGNQYISRAKHVCLARRSSENG